MLFGGNSGDKAKSDLECERAVQLRQFLKAINCKMKDVSLLDLAFRHRSSTNESAKSNNERLEFLGDAVLELIAVDYLFENFVGKTEGELSKIKAIAVSEAVLSEVALRFKINEYLILGNGEERSGGRMKKAILADAMEAVIAALYLDSGFSAAKKFVLSFLPDEITKIVENHHFQDFKTLVQEAIQKKFKTFPVYEVVKKTGPDHDQTFWVSARVNSTVFGPAQGKSKKDAEQSAAKLIWESKIF